MRRLSGEERLPIMQVKILSTASSPSAVRAEIEVNGVRVLVAFHTEGIIANGWEPYDQPDQAAYLPLGRDRLQAVDGAKGVLLVSAEAVRTSLLL